MITTAASNFYQSLYIVTIHDNDIMQKEEIVSFVRSDNETTSSDTDDYSLHSMVSNDDPNENEESETLIGTKEIDQPQLREPWRSSFFKTLELLVFVCGFVSLVAFLLVSSNTHQYDIATENPDFSITMPQETAFDSGGKSPAPSSDPTSATPTWAPSRTFPPTDAIEIPPNETDTVPPTDEIEPSDDTVDISTLAPSSIPLSKEGNGGGKPGSPTARTFVPTATWPPTGWFPRDEHSLLQKKDEANGASLRGSPDVPSPELSGAPLLQEKDEANGASLRVSPDDPSPEFSGAPPDSQPLTPTPTPSDDPPPQPYKKPDYAYTCRFCKQSAPVLHHDRSYTITTPTLGRSAVVTPMTITFDYELYDGQMISTNPKLEHLPNLEFDYAILEIGSIKNFYGDTYEPVSAYEVYLHHFTIDPIPKMFGAEDLKRGMDFDPVMSFPEGYALHTPVDNYPFFKTNAHLLSNKNLAPINSSLEQAHKECNECYYAPGKGALCTPAVSGTFACCGKTAPCIKHNSCSCATTTSKADGTRTTTKYRIEIDLLISKDIESFERVDIWTISAPSCFNEPEGGFPRDSACSLKKPNKHAPPFHHVPALSTEQPYYKTSVSVETIVNGNIVFSQGHLHSGGVNATLLQNGRIICTNSAEYGTDSDPSTNVGNEQNRLTYLSSCYDQIPTGGIRFEKGDVFTVETYYYGGANHPQYSSNLSSGDHKNVMSLFFSAVVIDQNDWSRGSIPIWNDEVVGKDKMAIWSN